MKKISLTTLAAILVLLACNKEYSKSSDASTTSPMLISVLNTSYTLAVSGTSFSSDDSISIRFTQPSDSITWWVYIPPSGSSDTTIYPGDTTYVPPFIPPPVDSTPPPPAPPHDSTTHPGDTVAIIYPPAPPPPPYISIPPPPNDSTRNPADTTAGIYNVFYPAVQPNAIGYGASVSQGNLKIRITGAGKYQIMAGAYQRNINGSFTLIATGYISFSAK